tara:strand:- start:3798 stop:4166 length:369 start_codon:yes stop_codon:yes gene_type:complete
MFGGYTYNLSFKKKSNKKSKKYNISKHRISKKNITAGRKRKHRKLHKKSHKKSHKKYRKKNLHRTQRGGQSLNYSEFNDSSTTSIPSRLPAGVNLNTVQGYSADLSEPPLSGISTVSQCTNI